MTTIKPTPITILLLCLCAPGLGLPSGLCFEVLNIRCRPGCHLLKPWSGKLQLSSRKVFHCCSFSRYRAEAPRGRLNVGMHKIVARDDTAPVLHRYQADRA